MAITYVSGSSASNASGATTITIAAPPGIVAGNLLIAVIYGASSSGNFIGPSGWTRVALRQTFNAYGGLGIFTRIATASEPISYTFGGNGGATFLAANLLQYSGTAGFDGSLNTSFGVSVGSGMTAPANTASNADDKVLLFYGVEPGVTIATPTGTTLRQHALSSGYESLDTFEAPVTAVGATPAYLSTPSGSAGTSYYWLAGSYLLLPGTPNAAPTANAGSDQSVAAGATVTLTGTDSDPDGNIVSRDWTQVSGPTVTLTGSGTTRTLTAPVAGTPSALVFRYTVTDAGGLSASDDVTVNVAALPAPVAAFTAIPTSGTSPLTVAFTDTSSGGPTSWAWDFGDGNTSTAQHPTHTYTAAGTYTATLTASNAGGNSTATTTISVASATVDRLRLGAGPVALGLGANPVDKVYLGDTLVWP